MNTKSDTIRVRVEPDVKIEAEKVLDKLGLSLSEAVRLYLSKIISDKAIPFDLSAEDVGDMVQETATVYRKSPSASERLIDKKIMEKLDTLGLLKLSEFLEISDEEATYSEDDIIT